MVAKHQRSSSPHFYAESIYALLDDVPGARACFIEATRNGIYHLHTALINAPEVDRWHATKGFSWIGNFSRGATMGQILEDVRETMGKA